MNASTAVSFSEQSALDNLNTPSSKKKHALKIYKIVQDLILNAIAYQAKWSREIDEEDKPLVDLFQNVFVALPKGPQEVSISREFILHNLMNFEKTTRANAYNRTTTQVAAPVAIEPVPKADAASVPSIPAPTSIGCFNQGANPLSRQSSVMRKEESKQPQLSSSSSQVSPTKRGFESKAESSFAAKKDDSKRRRLSGKDIRPPVPAASKASPSSQPDRHSLPGQSFSAESGSQPIPSPPSSSSSSAPTKPLTYHVGPVPNGHKLQSPQPFIQVDFGGRNEWRSPYDGTNFAHRDAETAPAGEATAEASGSTPLSAEDISVAGSSRDAASGHNYGCGTGKKRIRDADEDEDEVLRPSTRRRSANSRAMSLPSLPVSVPRPASTRLTLTLPPMRPLPSSTGTSAPSSRMNPIRDSNLPIRRSDRFKK